jgi:NADH:ubiquinone oxidoreductase subunit 6 (subunit J)
VRFDVIAAIVLGILIPTLETVRRGIGYWSVSFTTMFEDYLAGIALIVSALGALRGARWAPLSLLIVWSGVASMMLLSTVSQVERHFWGDALEPRSGVVLCAKLLLLLVCIVALSRSVRAVSADQALDVALED